MQIKEIEKLIKLIEKSELEEFEWEKNKEKIRLKKFSPQSHQSSMYPSPFISGMSSTPSIPSSPFKEEQEAAVSKEVVKEETKNDSNNDYYEIQSPFVGTFYSAPSPGSKNYVEVGEQIKKGDILCIVEAMKIMNEIDSDVSGKVVEILVKEGQAVQYGQVLFLIERN